MAAGFAWGEDTGAQTGSPLKGTTRTTPVSNANWKSIDDSTTAYTASPIVAGQNSFSKYQFGIFSGTWNTILNGLWSGHTAHSGSGFGTGITLKGTVSSTYATPSQTANAALTTDFSSVVAIGSGLTVLFTATGPEEASPSSSVTSGGTAYTQFLVQQLQTTSGASPGDTATVTGTLQYDEN